MMRGIAAVAGGLVAWIVVATLCNFVLRYSLAGYAEVEKAMSFTLGMLAARLVLGAVASLCAGAVVARIAKGGMLPVAILAGILFVGFAPTHYQIWATFPPWYHVTFFASLLVLPFVGAALIRRNAAAPA